MYEKKNRSVRYTRNFSKESNDSAKVFLSESDTNYPRNEMARTRKILMLVGILAIVLTIVAIIAIISSNHRAIEPSPKKGKFFKTSENPFTFL